MSYEDGDTTDSISAQWISFAQQAPLGGPCLPAESGPHADEGGGILSGMYPQGCTTIEDSRIPGRAGGLVTGSRVGSGNTYSETMPTNVITDLADQRGVASAGSQGSKRTTGMHARRKAWASV
jgi:hypothetical protein